MNEIFDKILGEWSKNRENTSGPWVMLTNLHPNLTETNPIFVCGFVPVVNAIRISSHAHENGTLCTEGTFEGHYLRVEEKFVEHRISHLDSPSRHCRPGGGLGEQNHCSDLFQGFCSTSVPRGCWCGWEKLSNSDAVNKYLYTHVPQTSHPAFTEKSVPHGIFSWLF